jgi:hypothetical protein
MLRSACVFFLLGATIGCAPAGDDKTSEEGDATHAAYQGCPLDDDTVVCADGQGCIATDVVARATGFCSQECAAANDCPDDADGRTKLCEQPDGATAQLCYVTCPSASSTCPDGMVCADLTSQAGTALRLCVPRD